MKLSARLLPLVLSLVVTPVVALAQSDWTKAKANAIRISAAWELKDVKFVDSDIATVETTPTGQILLGKAISAHLGQHEEPALTTLMTFVLLHELWHVKQTEKYGQMGKWEPKERPSRECQADVEASRALILDMLSPITDWANKNQVGATSAEIGRFRSTWRSLINDSPVGGDAHQHVTKRQRVVALQFGMWRAFADRLESEKTFLAPELREVGARLKIQSDTSDHVALHDWSLKICDRFVGYDKEVLEKLDFSPIPANLDTDSKLQVVKIAVSNKAYRDIEVAVTVMSGNYAPGDKENFEKYIFIDSASTSVTVKGGQRTELEVKVRFPFAPPGTELFIWQLPFLDQALLSARYVGQPQLPPNCNDAWAKNLGSVSPTFQDLTILAGYAPDHFVGLVTQIEKAFGNPLPIQKSSISARGALTTEVYGGFGDPNVVVTLYNGASKSEALAAFEASATAMEKACSGVAVRLHRWTSSDGMPNLQVDRLTAYSQASLVVSARTDKKTGEISYSVYWRLDYKEP